MSDIDLPIVNTNLMDIVEHGSEAFPIQYFVDELALYSNQSIPLHWHLELEFYVAYKGTVEIQVGKTILKIKAGEGIFINTNVLHSFKQVGDDKCICPNVVFSPTLITPSSSKIYKIYIQPIITNSALPYFILHHECNWHKEILNLLDKAFSLLQKYSSFSIFYGEFPILPFENVDVKCSCFEMEIQVIINKIWQILYINKNNIPKIITHETKHALQIRTQKMLAFIHDGYPYTITLEEIANAANISKSEASRCFQTYLRKSPMRYLMEYRLEKAKYLLCQSDDTIVEISNKCGFQTVSYFGKIFHREFHVTASQYRTKYRNRV